MLFWTQPANPKKIKCQALVGASALMFPDLIRITMHQIQYTFSPLGINTSLGSASTLLMLRTIGVLQPCSSWYGAIGSNIAGAVGHSITTVQPNWSGVANVCCHASAKVWVNIIWPTTTTTTRIAFIVRSANSGFAKLYLIWSAFAPLLPVDCGDVTASVGS